MSLFVGFHLKAAFRWSRNEAWQTTTLRVQCTTCRVDVDSVKFKLAGLAVTNS